MARNVVDVAADCGRGFLRSMIQHWSALAERQLLDIYQIPEGHQEAYRRYEEQQQRGARQHPFHEG